MPHEIHRVIGQCSFPVVSHESHLRSDSIDPAYLITACEKNINVQNPLANKRYLGRKMVGRSPEIGGGDPIPNFREAHLTPMHHMCINGLMSPKQPCDAVGVRHVSSQTTAIPATIMYGHVGPDTAAGFCGSGVIRILMFMNDCIGFEISDPDDPMSGFVGGPCLYFDCCWEIIFIVNFPEVFYTVRVKIELRWNESFTVILCVHIRYTIRLFDSSYACAGDTEEVCDGGAPPEQGYPLAANWVGSGFGENDPSYPVYNERTGEETGLVRLQFG